MLNEEIEDEPYVRRCPNINCGEWHVRLQLVKEFDVGVVLWQGACPSCGAGFTLQMFKPTRKPQ